jgi:hypothetical protein
MPLPSGQMADGHEELSALSDIDALLIRAWRLFEEDATDATLAEVEPILPPLAAAGYVQVEEHVWRFTPEGVERAEQLERSAQLTHSREGEPIATPVPREREIEDLILQAARGDKSDAERH